MYITLHAVSAYIKMMLVSKLSLSVSLWGVALNCLLTLTNVYGGFTSVCGGQLWACAC